MFSIGVMTYDRVELLKQTLSSILDQTDPDFEVIVGNNNPERIVSADLLRIKDARVRFVNHPENLGVLGNMRALLQLAQGRYFTWIADDDLYAANFLEAVYAALLKFNFPPCVYTSFSLGSGVPEEKIEYLRKDRLYRGRDFLRLYLARELRTIGTMGVYDRSYLRQIGGLEEMSQSQIALYTEYLYVMKAGLLKDVVFIDAPLIVFRDHEASWSNSNVEIELHRQAGQNLFRKGIEILQKPELMKDFDENLSRLLKWFMLEFVHILWRSRSFTPKQFLKYLFFARTYISTLKGSLLYWKALRCLAAAELWLVWSIFKQKAKPVTTSIRTQPSRVA